MDFYKPEIEYKNKVYYIYPSFRNVRSKDLMYRGKYFYAIWDEKKQLWSKDIMDAVDLIDEELEAFAKEIRKKDCRLSPVFL